MAFDQFSAFDVRAGIAAKAWWGHISVGVEAIGDAGFVCAVMLTAEWQ